MSTRPVSSMLMEAPVRLMMSLITLPPGPMTFLMISGRIMMVVMRGAYRLISLRGAARALASRRGCAAGRAGLLQRPGHDLVVRPVILMSIWMPVMPFLVPQTLKSMSPEVIFVTEDVGEDGDLLALLHQAHRDAGHRRLDRHAGVHQAKRAAADRAIELEPLDSRISETMRMV